MGQTGPSSTFTYGDQAVQCQFILTAPREQGETTGGNGGAVYRGGDDEDFHMTRWDQTHADQLPTYQNLFPLQDVLLWQLGGGASSVHRVANQIGFPGHDALTEIVAVILADLEISAWPRSTQLVVTLLWADLRRGERERRVGLTTGNLHLM